MTPAGIHLNSLSMHKKRSRSSTLNTPIHHVLGCFLTHKQHLHQRHHHNNLLASMFRHHVKQSLKPRHQLHYLTPQDHALQKSAAPAVWQAYQLASSCHDPLEPTCALPGAIAKNAICKQVELVISTHLWQTPPPFTYHL